MNIMEMDETQPLDLDLDEEGVIDDNCEVARLIVKSHDAFQQSFPIFGGQNIIGRHERADVYIPIKPLSKKHACIEVLSGQHFIYDFGSKNRTRRGKIVLRPNVKYELTDGCVLTFANVTCEYKISTQQKGDDTDSISDACSQSMFPGAENESSESIHLQEEMNNTDLCYTVLLAEATQPYGNETELEISSASPRKIKDEKYSRKPETEKDIGIYAADTDSDSAKESDVMPRPLLSLSVVQQTPDNRIMEAQKGLSINSVVKKKSDCVEQDQMLLLQESEEDSLSSDVLTDGVMSPETMSNEKGGDTAVKSNSQDYMLLATQAYGVADSESEDTDIEDHILLKDSTNVVRAASKRGYAEIPSPEISMNKTTKENYRSCSTDLGKTEVDMPSMANEPRISEAVKNDSLKIEYLIKETANEEISNSGTMPVERTILGESCFEDNYVPFDTVPIDISQNEENTQRIELKKYLFGTVTLEEKLPEQNDLFEQQSETINKASKNDVVMLGTETACCDFDFANEATQAYNEELKSAEPKRFACHSNTLPGGSSPQLIPRKKKKMQNETKIEYYRKDKANTVFVDDQIATQVYGINEPTDRASHAKEYPEDKANTVFVDDQIATQVYGINEPTDRASHAKEYPEDKANTVFVDDQIATQVYGINEPTDRASHAKEYPEDKTNTVFVDDQSAAQVYETNEPTDRASHAKEYPEDKANIVFVDDQIAAQVYGINEPTDRASHAKEYPEDKTNTVFVDDQIATQVYGINEPTDRASHAKEYPEDKANTVFVDDQIATQVYGINEPTDRASHTKEYPEDKANTVFVDDQIAAQVYGINEPTDRASHAKEYPEDKTNTVFVDDQSAAQVYETNEPTDRASHAKEYPEDKANTVFVDDQSAAQVYETNEPTDRASHAKEYPEDKANTVFVDDQTATQVYGTNEPTDRASTAKECPEDKANTVFVDDQTATQVYGTNEPTDRASTAKECPEDKANTVFVDDQSATQVYGTNEPTDSTNHAEKYPEEMNKSEGQLEISHSKKRQRPSYLQSEQQARSKRQCARRRPKIMFTGLTDKSSELGSKHLWADFTESVYETTHLVTDKARRSVKFLCCLSRGVKIVGPKWLECCRRAQRVMPDDDYVVDDKETEKQYNFELKKSLELARTNQILKGFEVYVTKNVKPCPKQMKDIIICAGGKALSKLSKVTKEKTLIISCEDDKADVKKIVDATRRNTYSAELLLTGVLQQKLMLDDFRYDWDFSRNDKRTHPQQDVNSSGNSRKRLRK